MDIDVIGNIFISSLLLLLLLLLS